MSRRSAPRSAHALGRFERSMVMNYEKWHDGIGYDLETLELCEKIGIDYLEYL